MAWRHDEDLLFLKELKNDDLELLFSILTRDPKDKLLRFTEKITSSEEYKKYGSNYRKYWKNIGAELQTYGGNTIATLFRGGKGVLYEEILKDVCKYSKIKYSKYDSVKEIEEKLLYKFLENAINDMSEEEKKEFLKSLNIKTQVKILTGKNLVKALQVAIKQGGFSSYKMAVIVANSISRMLLGRGLAFGTNAALTRAMGILAGPVGMAFMGAWTVIDIASPAMRVTVPATTIVATLRIINEN